MLFRSVSQSRYGGVSWDESADTYVRTGSTAGQTCGVTLADAFLPVHRRLRRCVVTDAGEVAYYLSATDSTKKEDGVTSANLDGTDGQVMVEIPKFWYRYGYSGTTHTWEVSPVPLTGFKVHEAFLSDTTEKDYLYVGAYEACLYAFWFCCIVLGWPRLLTRPGHCFQNGSSINLSRVRKIPCLVSYQISLTI